MELDEEEKEEDEEEEANRDPSEPVITFDGAYSCSAEDTTDVAQSIMAFAALQMRKSGKFSPGDIFRLKLKVRLATKPRKGKAVTWAPKAKPASKPAKASQREGRVT